MRTAEDYRIEDVQKVFINRRPAIRFKAFQRDPEQRAYVYAGSFNAPARTPEDALWKVADAALKAE